MNSSRNSQLRNSYGVLSFLHPPPASLGVCIFKLTGTIMHSIYSPLFMTLIGVAALLRLGCPVSRADFFCICVYMDIVWTTILHSCCQLPFHTSHIMNLFKQKSFSLGVFLSHLLLLCPILAILILRQSCDIIHCYSLFPKLLLYLSGWKGVGVPSTVIDIQDNASYLQYF